MSRSNSLKYNARSLVACLVAFTCTLCGCFSGSANPPTTVSLSELIPSANGTTVEQLSVNPPLYRVTVPAEGANTTVFATAFKQCGVKDYIPSKATTRELFVGFEKLNITSQEFVESSGQKIFRSELTASLDDQPVNIVSYTVRSKDCVSDFAFWKNSAQPAAVRSLVEASVLEGIARHD